MLNLIAKPGQMRSKIRLHPGNAGSNGAFGINKVGRRWTVFGGAAKLKRFHEHKLLHADNQQGVVKVPNAPVPPYGNAIRDALRRKDISLDELKLLRQQAIELIKSQGDLAGVLIDLEEEIKRRGG
jgi:hypothetical protein